MADDRSDDVVVPRVRDSVTRRLRDDNAFAVLHHVWDLSEVLTPAEPPAGPPADAPEVTASDLMRATGLSRATVHDVCDELIERGWLEERRTARPAPAKGRPARRYALRAGAGAVVGVDAGAHRLAARVTDLRGRVLGEASAVVEHDVALDPPQRRVEAVEEVVLAALERAGDPRLLALAVGVPAPVDADGRTVFTRNPYWAFMNPDLAAALTRRRGWPAVVDNDANLAALAESGQGQGVGVADQVTLLAGERFGAGVVAGGRLLRGARGGAGEMRHLDIVAGVGSADGLGKVLRDLAGTGRGPGSTAPEVVAAAAAGGLVATALVEIAGLRLTRVVVTLASLLDPERVVVAGGIADAAPLVDVVNRELPAFLDPPRPLVVASTLGRDVVALGAVRRALDEVRRDALVLTLV
ncbi:putative NBD/HSP70 family sugar kinase [Kineococcus radiotolerans]|uniref:Putative NBD/HSP70 family sugar kinase n=1 Tax=Kineococcus radiotolerans TaxID=131568 RepID=A0A7W4XXU7_KINRA|nr:ROK family transcriptional regulator [Kineococcus radiotolerans]MBB2901605.1 putative NBD/HSP70 family sugar kinase [Kineococcus radiotolerans]